LRFDVLNNEIVSAKANVKTDSLALSIGEVASMYKDSELDISPEFQRLFRWSIRKQSDFVESVLIGIPIPAIFAYEKEDGTWELIDGLQRVSTILKFMGLLRHPDIEGELEAPSKLVGTKYLSLLEGVVWDSASQDRVGGDPLEKALQLFFRRSRIDIQVLKQPSDARTKFDLFQRLNRGGAYANEQEVRTCAMVMVNKDYTSQIRSFAETEAFETVFRVNDKQKENQTNIEYAVRLICHIGGEYDPSYDVGEYLDRSITRILEGDLFEGLLETAVSVVDILARVGGDRVLIPNAGGGAGNAAPRFSLRALEAIAAGIGRNLSAISQLADPDRFVRDRIDSFWEQPEVVEMSASGLRGTVRLQRTIPFGQRWFDPAQ